MSYIGLGPTSRGLTVILILLGQCLIMFSFALSGITCFRVPPWWLVLTFAVITHHYSLTLVICPVVLSIVFVLLINGFPSLLSDKISLLLSSNPRSFGPLDDWRFCSQNIRKFLKGWGANHAVKARRDKVNISDQIENLHSMADSVRLCHSECAQRYALEAVLMDIHR